MGGEKAAQKRIGGVATAGDIFSDDVAIKVYEVRDEMLENVVDVFVPAVPTVPCFDNSLVVTIDKKGGAGFSEEEKSVGEELEARCFCPPDVTAICVPTWP